MDTQAIANNMMTGCWITACNQEGLSGQSIWISTAVVSPDSKAKLVANRDFLYY